MTESKLETALQLVNAGIPVYPLQINGTKPISAHGFHDATTGIDSVKHWFDNNRRFNIGMALESNHLLVVDIDVNHKSNLDGLSSYRKLAAKYDRLTENTYIIKTPHGGLHYFFRLPRDVHIKSTALCKFSEPKLAAYTGIDIQTYGTPYVGTTTPSGSYRELDNGITSPLDSAECPPWLLSLLTDKVPQHFKKSVRRETRAGNLVGELFYPNADMGTRNVYLTSLCGRLLALPVRPDAAYQALHLANSNLPTPLPDKEVNQIFKSILKKELSKAR